MIERSRCGRQVLFFVPWFLVEAGRLRPCQISQSLSSLDPHTLSTPVGPDPSHIDGIPDIQPLNTPSSNIYPSIVKPEEIKASG